MFKLQEQGDIKGLSAPFFPFEMLTSCKAPWMAYLAKGTPKTRYLAGGVAQGIRATT
jgi:hypothetical protein